jgi:hypothetical protein
MSSITRSRPRTPTPPTARLFRRWIRRRYAEGVRPRNIKRLFRLEAEEILQKSNLVEGIFQSPVFPLDAGASENFPQLVVYTISTMCYLLRQYPHLFKTPTLSNLFLSIMVRWRLPSVPAIFRKFFSYHKWRIGEKHVRFAGEASPRSVKIPWCWPLRDAFSYPRTWPQGLPRSQADKYTYLRAMEYAHYTRDPLFAREVWQQRKFWKGRLQRAAKKNLRNIRWSKVEDADILRQEREIVDPFGSIPLRNWAKGAAFLSEQSDGASNTLFEGYIRLLYIQVLAANGLCHAALLMILQGTGESYDWTRAMLEKVEKYAIAFKHRALFEYIAGLESSGTENTIQALEGNWMEEAESEKSKPAEEYWTDDEIIEPRSNERKQL